MPERILRNWTDSRKFENLSAESERLFIRVIMSADDFGRFHGDSRLIKAACFPLHDHLRTNEVDRWLDELSTRQLILRYEVCERKLIAIVNFRQRLRTVRAKFPPPEGKASDWLASDGDPLAHVGNPPQSAADCGQTADNPPQCAASIEEKRREIEEKREREGDENSRSRSLSIDFDKLPPEPELPAKPRELTLAQESMQKINGLKPEWAKPAHWTAAEMHDLHGSLSAICELTATDWDMMRRYLATKLPQGAGYWQPSSRSQFVKAFCDVFQHAQRWDSKQGGSQGNQNTPLNPYA